MTSISWVASYSTTLGMPLVLINISERIINCWVSVAGTVLMVWKVFSNLLFSIACYNCMSALTFAYLCMFSFCSTSFSDNFSFNLPWSFFLKAFISISCWWRRVSSDFYILQYLSVMWASLSLISNLWIFYWI